MLGERLRRRLRSMWTAQAVLACVFSLLLITSGSLVLITTAQESPDGVDDGETFTVRTGGIYPHLSDGGQICADKIGSDVNKVTVSDSTLRDVDIYLGDEGGVETHINFPSGEVNGDLVLYTNGKNPLVNTLATLGICLPPGIPNPLPTTLEAYWLGVDNLEPEEIEISSGGEAPNVSSSELSDLLDRTDTSREELGINNSTETNNSTANTTNETLTNTTTETANQTNETLTNETTETAKTNETAETANQTNETTETAKTNETAETANQTNETTEAAKTNETTEAETSVTPEETAQPSPTTTEDDDDGILSGIFGWLSSERGL